ncbi:MAG: bifunctional phosphoribosylaminoimidazolecarboxamide formyltransferase/IMP cyclohydrolase [Bdellovibrionota bacterium]
MTNYGIHRAFISVSDKTNLKELCSFLASIQCEMVGTSSTCKAILEYGFPCISADSLTQFPEMLGGRVKTLHPNIFGAILGRPTLSSDQNDMQKFNIKPFDLVVCNLYPFQDVLAKSPSAEELVENIDIGGVSLLRAAAKNHATVNILCDVSDYFQFIKIIKENENKSPLSLRRELALKALRETASYDELIAATLTQKFEIAQSLSSNLGPVRHKNTENINSFPNSLSLNLSKIQPLRYGENPHQQAAFYKMSDIETANSCSLANIKCFHGKELSYNNVLDVEHAVRLTKEFYSTGSHAAIIVKHNTPCGVGISTNSLTEAYLRAFEHDPVSPFGGIVCTTTKVTAELAHKLLETFLEVVIAPEFEEQAQELLQKKKNLRLVTYNATAPLANKLIFTHVQGGFLAQSANDMVVDLKNVSFPTIKKPSQEILNAMQFAMTIAKHVRSNAIVVANAFQSISIAGGFTNRVDAVELALSKAKTAFERAPHSPHFQERILASDAFFPFPDSIELIQNSGIQYIVQPGGSVQDGEVIKACDKYGLCMIFTGNRHFKH